MRFERAFLLIYHLKNYSTGNILISAYWQQVLQSGNESAANLGRYNEAWGEQGTDQAYGI